MDIANILLFCLMSLIIGAVLMLLVQYYAFVRYFNLPEETDEQKSMNEKYALPDSVMMSIKSPDPESKTPIVGINLVMQFLFHELRHSNKVRKWFHRKLSLELDELITKTTTGKLFDKLSIRDLDLGGQFPEIKNLRVHSADLHDTEGHLESLDLLLDLHYCGNFRLSIDADMVLGKKGFLSVKVKHISGLARLQFTRKPYTHWSLCFLGDPQVDLGIETQFQGRQMQSNVTSLISNQIRKAIRRKHTLPNYKLRYKPFFHKTEEDFDISEQPLDGSLEVCVLELSRLVLPSHITHVYCTLTLASIPWVLARQNDDRNVIVSLDMEIHKAKNQQIGIVFKQTESAVTVEAVIPNTPATKAKLLKGDQLLSIEGKRVTNINHVAKIIKSLNRPAFMLRIERSVPGLIKNDAVLEDFAEVYEDFNDMNITFSKNTDSVQIGSKMLRKNSVDRLTSSDSSHSNTPSNSPRKFGDLAKRRTGSLSRGNSETKSLEDSMSRSTHSSKTALNGESAKSYTSDTVDQFQQHSTIDCLANSLIRMNDTSTFALSENLPYLNVNVYGRCNDDNILLGYVNIPVGLVLAECSESNLGHFIKQYSLNPPEAPNLSNHQLSSQSGFDPYMCFGDVLVSYAWTGCSNMSSFMPSFDGIKKTPTTTKSAKGSTDKLEIDRPEPQVIRQHDFIRTHFHRSTQCDFCGKKIWLKDAVQCRECAMCCHKKCITKCQNSTVCGPTDISSAQQMHQVDIKLTEAPVMNNDDLDMDADDCNKSRLDAHRQSFSDLLAQGLKRVNSANNLANNLNIPGMGSSVSQNSRSLPPSPQHTPRKQSLVNNQSTNPFATVALKLEQLPDELDKMSSDEIGLLTEPLIGFGSPDELMGLAKTASKSLYSDFEPKDRVDKINKLLSKLRIALDSETNTHANISASPVKVQDRSQTNTINSTNVDSVRTPSDTNLLLQTKGPSEEQQKKSGREQETEAARRAFLLGQSEERVQALSVVMLHLCTGLQHAQGVAGQ